MGVLNVTPDSFSDGGRFLDPAIAIEQAAPDGRGGRRHPRHRRGIDPSLWRRRSPFRSRRKCGGSTPVLPGVGRARRAGLDRHHEGRGGGLGARVGRRDRQRRVGPAARPRHGARGGRARRAGDHHAQPRGGRSIDRHHGRYRGVLLPLARDRRARRHRAREHRARPRHRLRQDAGAERHGHRPARRAQILRPAAADRRFAQALHRQGFARRRPTSAWADRSPPICLRPQTAPRSSARTTSPRPCRRCASPPPFGARDDRRRIRHRACRSMPIMA